MIKKLVLVSVAIFLNFITYSQKIEEYQQIIDDYEIKSDKYTEPWRAQYHFSNIQGWMNDPNGMVYNDGVWHLGYQHGLHLFESTSWGYATSTDLVHWEQQTPMLYGEPQKSYWSGCAIVDSNNTSKLFSTDQGGIIAYYTVIDTSPEKEEDKKFQDIRIAYTEDNWRTYKQYENNPVILKQTFRGLRDPKVFYHKAFKKWFMIVAQWETKKTGIYESENLLDWKKSFDIPYQTECPDMFPLAVDGNANNRKWVVNLGGRKFIIGDFDGKSFTEISNQPANFGEDAYAAQSFANAPNDRIVVMNWLMHWNYGSLPTKPFSGGHQTLPLELSLKIIKDTSGKEKLHVYQNPLENLKKLRNDTKEWSDICFKGSKKLEGLAGKSVEIEMILDPFQTKEFKLNVFSNKSGSQKTVIGFDAEKYEVYVNRSKSSDYKFKLEGKLPNGKPKQSRYYLNNGKYSAPIRLMDGKLKLRIFLDQSTVEVFVNDGEQVINTIVFPNKESSFISLHSKGGKVKIEDLKLHQMTSIWRE